MIVFRPGLPAQIASLLQQSRSPFFFFSWRYQLIEVPSYKPLCPGQRSFIAALISISIHLNWTKFSGTLLERGTSFPKFIQVHFFFEI